MDASGAQYGLAKFGEHALAAVAEGICPAHGTPLEPLKTEHRSAGRCAGCGGRWVADEHTVAWESSGYDLPA